MIQKVDRIEGKINYTEVAFGMMKTWFQQYMPVIIQLDLYDDLIQEIYMACLVGKRKNMNLEDFKKLMNKRFYEFKTQQLGLHYTYERVNEKKVVRRWKFMEVSLNEMGGFYDEENN